MARVSLGGDVPLAVETVLAVARSSDAVFWIESLDPARLLRSGLVIDGDITKVLEEVRSMKSITVKELV